MPKRNDPKNSGTRLGRRDFVKLVGGTGVAVSTGVLGEGVLEAQAPPTGIIGPGALAVTLRINGQNKTVTIEPRVTLLDALRNYLDLTGAKKVCDRGTCGACTVMVNGKAVYSCSILAIDLAARPRQPAADIRTIEGLAPEGQLHPLSKAFVENDAQQCGFCTPGFVMACKAYLDAHPNPTYEQVQKALGGNLCRCGTYVGVRKAVLDIATRTRGAPRSSGMAGGA